jgi:hypothetical protein
VQDFYAHTNYVELMAIEHPTFAEVPIVELWRAEGMQRLQQLEGKGLVSGYVWWEPGDKCGPPNTSHADLNKDSDQSSEGAKFIQPWGMTHFRAAHELAIRATRAYLNEFLSRPPGPRWSTIATC